MILNGKEFEIQAYDYREVEQDTILYNKTEGNVILLNNTARDILGVLDTDETFTTKQIALLLMEKYKLGESEYTIVCRDIEETIGEFIKAKLLLCLE